MSFRLFFTNALLVVASVTMANNYSVKTIPSLIMPGENFLLLVSLENTEQTQVSAWDFKVVLPEGVTFVNAQGTADFGTISTTPEVFSDGFSTNIVKDSKEANTYYVYSFSAGKTNNEEKTTLVILSLKSDASAITEAEENIDVLLKSCSIADNSATSYSLDNVNLTLAFGSSTTGVEEIETGGLANEDADVYDLQGRRVNTSTTNSKGVYLKAGKKMVRK